MAHFKYFADLVDGSTVQLSNVHHDGAFSTAAIHFHGTGPDGAKYQATRKIDYKKNPSRHKCDTRCLNAKGHSCECSRNGANHGRG